MQAARQDGAGRLATGTGNGGRLRSAEPRTSAQAARQYGAGRLANGTGRRQAAEERGEAALCSMRAARQYGAGRLARALCKGGRLRSAERQTAAQAARQSGNFPQLASGTGRWQAAEERGEAALCTMQPARQYGACRLANGSTQRRAAGAAASRPGQAGRERQYAPAGRLQMDSLWRRAEQRYTQQDMGKD